MLLHDDNNLHGWGQFAIPDPSLLYVRGFDPSTNRYKYEVNQRFGATNPQFSAFRAPVTLTALFRFDVGPTRERQLLTHAAESRSYAARPEAAGANAPTSCTGRAAVCESARDDSPAAGQSPPDGKAGGQHRVAESLVLDPHRLDLVAGREVSRHAAGPLR